MKRKNPAEDFPRNTSTPKVVTPSDKNTWTEELYQQQHYIPGSRTIIILNNKTITSERKENIVIELLYENLEPDIHFEANTLTQILHNVEHAATDTFRQPERMDRIY